MTTAILRPLAPIQIYVARHVLLASRTTIAVKPQIAWPAVPDSTLKEEFSQNLAALHAQRGQVMSISTQARHAYRVALVSTPRTPTLPNASDAPLADSARAALPLVWLPAKAVRLGNTRRLERLCANFAPPVAPMRT